MSGISIQIVYCVRVSIVHGGLYAVKYKSHALCGTQSLSHFISLLIICCWFILFSAFVHRKPQYKSIPIAKNEHYCMRINVYDTNKKSPLNLLYYACTKENEKRRRRSCNIFDMTMNRLMTDVAQCIIHKYCGQIVHINIWTNVNKSNYWTKIFEQLQNLTFSKSLFYLVTEPLWNNRK